ANAVRAFFRLREMPRWHVSGYKGGTTQDNACQHHINEVVDVITAQAFLLLLMGRLGGGY
ncbi:hypothetical protein TY87_21910, partial [Marinomonas sp. BSi20584]